MTRAGFAIWTLTAGLIIGVLGSALLYPVTYIGAGFPIMVVLLTTALIGSGYVARRPLNRRNLWLFIPTVFFALMLAVRADPQLIFYNVSLTLALGALAVHHMADETPFDLTSTAEQLGNVIVTGIRSALDMPFTTAFRSRHWFAERSDKSDEDQKNGPTGAILRGLLVTLPVIIVFALLLGSADAVFANYLPSFAWLTNLEIDAAVERAILTGVIGWFAIGTMTYGLARDWVTETDASPHKDDTIPEQTLPDRTKALKERPKRALPAAFRLSMIEGGMLLGAVNLLFGAFVLVQFVYLFGGQQNIGVDGLSYAEYARRGFFELVTVAVLTMGLLLTADRFVVRDGKRETRLFRVLSVIVIALVGVMLLSAARRMALYTDEFGLTRLRLWTSLFMAWLGVLFLFLIASIYRLRRRVFSFGLVIVAIGYFGMLNVINPDARIASHNIHRAFEGGEELDTCYLSQLSPDAVPVIAARFEESGDERLGQLLSSIEAVNRYDAGQGIAAYNAGQVNATAALAELADDIPTYDPTASVYTECYLYLRY